MYEAWMKQWNTYKFNWIESDDVIDAFVLNVVPPDKKYSTMLHFELTLEIDRSMGFKTRINQKEKRIDIQTGSPLKPSIYFHNEGVCSRYPWTVDYGMTVNSMTATTEPLDIQDDLGFVALRLEDFRRVYILKIVMIMKRMGFGVLHGVVESGKHVVGGSSKRFHSKIPNVDDPIWMYV